MSNLKLSGDISLPKAIQGKSAYEIALLNGFQGTEEEWLNSLNGGLITVDKQLYRDGHAADAKVTGEKLAELNGKIDTETSGLESAIATERARITNLATLEEGSTTGDAELIDARVDFKGTTWSNLGTHIREVMKRFLITGDRVINSATTNVAPYNDANTLPIGSIVTYIGKEYLPSNLPDNLVNSICTIMTFNFRNTTQGGAIQIYYAQNECFYRISTSETAYAAWRKLAGADEVLLKSDYYNFLITGQKVVNSAATRTAPYDNANTLPIGSIVTYIGKENLPTNKPSHINKAINTILTFNYRNSSMGGAVQLWFAKNEICWRIAESETEYRPWNTLSNQLDNQNLMPLFETFGVIGDSYSTGVITLDSYTGQEHRSISWGQIMARKNGILCTNFGYGGLTTRTWLTNQYGAPLLQSESAKKLYILALGINDNAILGTDYLGSLSDIKTSDYTLNADTFYGNYGRIIAMIKEKAPNAKIVISTLAPSAPGRNVEVYNEAITAIAAFFSIPLLVQGEDFYFTSSLYTDNIRYNHPTATGYAHMAAAFERMICKAINYNQEYFSDYMG